MFSGFGGDEAAEPTAFGKVGLASAAVIAILIGGWVSLRPQESEAAAVDDSPKSSVTKPDDSRSTLADGDAPDAKGTDELAPPDATRTEAVRDPVAKATTPAAAPVAATPSKAAVEPARKPARKRAPRPKTPPPADKPKQTSGMGPL